MLEDIARIVYERILEFVVKYAGKIVIDEIESFLGLVRIVAAINSFFPLQIRCGRARCQELFAC